MSALRRLRDRAAVASAQADGTVHGATGSPEVPPGERWCLWCDKAGHQTHECWSTVAVNTPEARELWRMSAASATQTPAPAQAGMVLVPVETLQSIVDSSSDPHARGFARAALKDIEATAIEGAQSAEPLFDDEDDPTALWAEIFRLRAALAAHPNVHPNHLKQPREAAACEQSNLRCAGSKCGGGA